MAELYSETETESQVVVSSPEFTEPLNKSHDLSQHYVTRSGQISKPPETNYELAHVK